MSFIGKYAYETPRTNSPRLSRWATLAFTPRLVFAAILYLSSVIMARPWRAELLLSLVPILIITVPFSFLYCLICSPVSIAVFSRSTEPKEPSILFICLLAGAIAGLLSAWLVYPKLEKPDSI